MSQVDWGAASLSSFLVALYSMTPEQRAQASAEKAAKRYGISQDHAQGYIEMARRTNEVWPITGGKDGRRKTGS